MTWPIVIGLDSPNTPITDFRLSLKSLQRKTASDDLGKHEKRGFGQPFARLRMYHEVVKIVLELSISMDLFDFKSP